MEVGGGRWEREVKCKPFQMFIGRNGSHYNSSLFCHESLVSIHVPRFCQITDIGTVVVVIGHHSARTDIGMPVYDGSIRANIGFLVDTVKTRGGTASRGTRRGAVTRCLTLRRQVVTTARRRRGRSRVIRTVNNAWRHARNHRRIATPPRLYLYRGQ